VLEHVRDVGAQMVLDQQLVEGCERLLDRAGLGDDVHAVVLVLDHLRKPRTWPSTIAVRCRARFLMSSITPPEYAPPRRTVRD
jgi:glucuronate isomerase